jgi:hypothetical protein
MSRKGRIHDTAADTGTVTCLTWSDALTRNQPAALAVHSSQLRAQS